MKQCCCFTQFIIKKFTFSQTWSDILSVLLWYFRNYRHCRRKVTKHSGGCIFGNAMCASDLLRPIFFIFVLRACHAAASSSTWLHLAENAKLCIRISDSCQLTHWWDSRRMSCLLRNIYNKSQRLVTLGSMF